MTSITEIGVFFFTDPVDTHPTALPATSRERRWTADARGSCKPLRHPLWYDGHLGFVVDIRSSWLFIPKKKIPAVLRAMKKFAGESPREFVDVEATLAAKDLATALAANYWRATFDDEGNVIALEHTADKLPVDCSDLAPQGFLQAISRNVEHGTIELVTEADPATLTYFSLGTKFRRSSVPRGRYRFETVVPSPRANPGGTSRVEVRLVHQWGDEVAVVPSMDDPLRCDVSASVPATALHGGETCEVTVHVGPEALGKTSLHLDGHAGNEPVARSVIEFQVEPVTREPLEIDLVEENSLLSRKFLLAAREVPRALADLRAHATKARAAGGADFLDDVARAPDFVQALAAAGLDATLEPNGIVKNVVARTGTLPCSEYELLALLTSFARHTLAGSDAGFRFVKRGVPSRWIEYQFSADLDRYVTKRE